MLKAPRPPSGRTNLASCIMATIFLIFVVIIVLIVYFIIFKLKDPNISTNAVQLPSFSVAPLLGFSSRVHVIPARKIKAGRTKYKAATFVFQSFRLAPLNEASVAMLPTTTTTTGPIGLIGGFGGGNNGYRVGPTMEIESRMETAGWVQVLHFFTHYVDAKSRCRVTIAGSTGDGWGVKRRRSRVVILVRYGCYFEGCFKLLVPMIQVIIRFRCLDFSFGCSLLKITSSSALQFSTIDPPKPIFHLFYGAGGDIKIVVFT
ncbi:hypothetical protein PTKIN_Ptkin05aG0071800 [Pterospermum kingtungense]